MISHPILHHQYSTAKVVPGVISAVIVSLLYTASFPMLNLATVAPWLQNQGVYGPVTATLDWCEVRIRTLASK